MIALISFWWNWVMKGITIKSLFFCVCLYFSGLPHLGCSLVICPWWQVGWAGPEGPCQPRPPLHSGWEEVWDSDAQARAGPLGWLKCGWAGAVEGFSRVVAGTPKPAQEPFRRVQSGPGQKRTGGSCNSSSLQMTMFHFWGRFVVVLNSDITM